MAMRSRQVASVLVAAAMVGACAPTDPDGSRDVQDVDDTVDTGSTGTGDSGSGGDAGDSGTTAYVGAATGNQAGLGSATGLVVFPTRMTIGAASLQ